MSEKRNLPTYASIIKEESLDKADKSNDLNILLNQPAHEPWVKDHPYVKLEIQTDKGKVKVPYRYLPIDKVEYMMRRIFRRYRFEILREGSSFNGVYVSARVHFWNPVFEDWDWHDGIGAVQLQTKKGSSPADLANINHGALAMAYPAAYTYAIKNACGKIGKVFGSDLNREDAIPFIPEQSTQDAAVKRVEMMLDDCSTVSEVESVRQQIPAKYRELADEKIKYLKEKKKDD